MAPRASGRLADGQFSAEEIVMAYHERTKHHYHRSAASLGYMDWDTQPDPFRRYDGAPLLRLPLPKEGRELPYWQLYITNGVKPALLTIDSLSLFFRYSLSLSAWKHYRGSTWSLRVNPSSGNLHPTEGYALLPARDAVHDRPGVYHYAPKEHGLERRAEVVPSVWAALTHTLPESSFFVGLSSVHWREAWKYGERAFRYCQHDVGHVLGTMRFAATALGWKLVWPARPPGSLITLTGDHVSVALYAAAGLANDEIAARLDTPRQIVSKWRKRFFEQRFAGLEEQSRGGRPTRFPPQGRRRR